MSLTVKDLAKRYGGNWVLRGVSFEAASGSVTGVFGPKGTGKSSLLRVIAGLEEKNGGEFRIDGRTVADDHATDGIVYVPTVPASPFFQRAFGNKATDTVDAARRQADAIEAALTGPDRIVLLDEPFCFFDRALKHEFTDRIRRTAAEKGLTVVFAANSFEEVLLVADRAVALTNGYVAQEGTPEDIYDMPASTLVSRMTGRANLIEVRRLSSSKSDLPEFQTLNGGHRLFAQKTAKSELGAINQSVHLAIRPEQISISFGASFPEDNLLKASISAVRFLGPLTLVSLDANGLSIDAYVPRLIGLSVGDDCMVGLPPDRLRVLKD